jgi:putative transposase
MRLQRTAKIRLQIHPKALRESVDAYTKAFNYICNFGWANNVSSSISLQKATYTYCREELGLPAQLACSAAVKAAEAIKSAKARLKAGRKASCPQSKHCPIRYDARSYTLFLNSGKVSLLTMNGRIKVDLLIPEYFHQYLEWKHLSADLILVGDKAYLHVVFQEDVEQVESNGNYVGIDRGIKKIAVTSNNQFYGGGKVKQVSNRYATLRGNLQASGTRSAQRHLAKIARKERRFRANTNHCITKKIVSSLAPGSTVVLENLKGIRDRCKFGKAMRSQMHKWSFFQFQQFLSYKAAGRGISIEYIDPRNTSKACSVCGHIDDRNRKSQARFQCVACGFRCNADLNGARNIRNKSGTLHAISDGLKIVNQPIVFC